MDMFQRERQSLLQGFDVKNTNSFNFSSMLNRMIRVILSKTNWDKLVQIDVGSHYCHLMMQLGIKLTCNRQCFSCSAVPYTLILQPVTSDLSILHPITSA
eukprot:907499_1